MMKPQRHTSHKDLQPIQPPRCPCGTPLDFYARLVSSYHCQACRRRQADAELNERQRAGQ